MRNSINKILLVMGVVFSANTFAANPWNCVTALGASDSNNPATSGCDSNSNQQNSVPQRVVATPAVEKNLLVPTEDASINTSSSNSSAMMYIVNHYNSPRIIQCKVLVNGVNLFTCNNIEASQATAKNFQYVKGITATNKMLYITSSRYITMCQFDANGVDGDSCKEVAIENSGYSPAILNNNLLYATNSKVARCPIGANGLIDGSKCNSVAMGDDSKILALTVANNMLYVVKDGGYNKPNTLVQCAIVNGDIDSSTCTAITPTGVGSIEHTSNIYVNNSSAFIVNERNITQCELKASSIQADSCQNYTIKGSNSLSDAFVYDNRLYAIDYSKLYQCDFKGNKLDAGSCKALEPGGDNKLNYPSGVIIK